MKERAEKIVRQSRTKDNWREKQSDCEEDFDETERLVLKGIELFEERERRKVRGHELKRKKVE